METQTVKVTTYNADGTVEESSFEWTPPEYHRVSLTVDQVANWRNRLWRSKGDPSKTLKVLHEIAFANVNFDLPATEAELIDDIDAVIWLHQDGYGERGYTPPQGWDWSAIRDSSAESIEEMRREVLPFLSAYVNLWS